ncbi:MAG: nucleoside triphosphate pyrophosphohydrolase [Candidatus Marinimicrobia bacterium]|jgi:MazG family protein|nr:nucleoside triphosphate pyrophosphohydrolase [Candidatus Neomarinimicrobiota bacterium]MBT3677120.1 nucleoside triphosphate pyrophosphohydrolase [Candidatus Neomarinimicrobiota bacterium]MBT3763615.1 nucleoside triphosphate pyrophosphohydrolase [Candidatus Neomarinimicrobiota bacterium]MBT4067204.1 nucleoside triphosphate pyrophosphohydrolase [Candidatus Neomarinimicrobiota bacterium]MBT4270397.1 nucleoside triphosphate pyrophosphohydrolase [Candidatus Neomarinimicrobiota bacterium]
MGDMGKRFEELVRIVERLRASDGCPWDREQTNESLLPYFIEEAYEVIESVDEKNWENLKEELGDILLHVVFQASIAEDDGKFKLDESLKIVNEKLVNRHPHVFGDAQADAAFHAKQNWEAAKHKEKGRKSRLDGVPNNLPALVRAQRLQQKASYAGFDWDKVEQVWDKIHEEILELKEAQDNSGKDHIAEEIGDVIFSIVNLARFLDIPAEDALRKTNKKFIRRFKNVEEGIKAQGKELDEATLEEMDAIWNEAKKKE